MTAEWRTALHEAAHAVVALAVGADVDLVSIRPGKRHAGVTFPIIPDWHGDADAAAATPGPFVDPELRRVLEMRAVVALAGDLGEMLAAPPPTGYGTTRDERTAVALSRSLDRHSPRHVELLHRTEAETEVADDFQLASDAARGLGVGDEVTAHVAWLRTVAQQLVRNLQPEIVAVAEELSRRKVLTGAEVRAAMRSAYPFLKGDPTR